MRPILFAFAFACVVVAASAASADEGAGVDATAARAEETGEEAGEEPENGISVRLLGGLADEPGAEAAVIVGAGIAYERDFFDNLVAVEFALEALAEPEATNLVAELVVEKPIELNESLGLYLGGGPTVGVHLVDDRVLPGAGGLALIGGEWFIAGGFEIFLELDTAFLYFERPVVEADVGLGALYRF